VTSFALFLLRRLLGIAILVWAVTLAAFGLFRVGVPSPATDAQINAQLGPGEPASWQYLHYLLRLLHGNLGETLTVGLSVNTLLWRALPPTLSLMIGGMILWLTAGIVAGMVSALRPGSWTDKVVTGAAVAALIIPTFLLALVLLALSTYLTRTGHLWVQTGYVPITQNPGQWLGRMILPWIAIAAAQAGVTAKLTRAVVLDIVGENYIRTAYAKGLDSQRVFWIHVLRPAIIPVIASIGAGFGIMLGSAAIIDQVFALNGIGQALLTAVKQGDLMVVMGAVLVAVILISLVNLIADVCQAVLDPRVHVTLCCSVTHIDYDVVMSKRAATPVRFDPPVADRLASFVAANPGMSLSSAANRLVDEALRMAEHPGIIFRSGPTGRRAALAGGPDVWEVIRAIKSAHLAEPGLNGNDLVSLVSSNTGIALRLVNTAVRYWAAYPSEVDAEIAAADAAEEAAEQAWLRERQLLAG
jgi:peptide/nickel transport system permease protein